MNAETLYGLSPSSLFYVVVYILTFLAHFAGISYVVGGILYLAFRQLFSRDTNLVDSGISLLVRDWMPFAFSAAITLGVAPLLFVQVIYPKHFYTANLLFGWRWMLIIPVLITGFYLLYLIKSKYFETVSRGPRVLILSFTTLCFLFVGAGWSANHILMQFDTSWPHIYFDISALDTVFPFMLIRMSVWIGGMLMTFPLLIAWQTRWVEKMSAEESQLMAARLRRTVRCGALLAILGLGVMHLPLFWSEWDHLNEWLFRWMLVIAMATGLLYWICWESIQMVPASLSRISIVTLVWIVGAFAAGSAREMNRMGTIDLQREQRWMEDAAVVHGYWTFLAFVLINGFLMGYCIRIVTRRLKQPTNS